MEPRVRVQILLRERDVDEGIFSGDRDRQAGARESHDALAQVLHVAAPARHRLAAVRRAEGQAIFLERARPPQGEQLRAVREDQPPAQRVRRGRGLELQVQASYRRVRRVAQRLQRQHASGARVGEHLRHALGRLQHGQYVRRRLGAFRVSRFFLGARVLGLGPRPAETAERER